VSQLDSRDAQDLLWWLVRAGFGRHVVGPAGDPRVIVLFHVWGDYLDVVHVRGVVWADAARIPKSGGCNLYRPACVVWHYWGGIMDALTALKRLPPPDDPIAPTRPYEPPRDRLVFPGRTLEALAVRSDELEHVTVPTCRYQTLKAIARSHSGV
jgi:hypothetical protein